ncbi:hypothetical protein [Nostoc sp. PA-18-2419]|nr:hypothetical protein [Nostoc sp. PA-18-2419]
MIDNEFNLIKGKISSPAKPSVDANASACRTEAAYRTPTLNQGWA